MIMETDGRVYDDSNERPPARVVIHEMLSEFPISSEARDEATRMPDDMIYMQRLEYGMSFPSLPIGPAVDIILPSFPWYTRGFVGRVGLTRMNLGLEALLTRTVNIITHMIGFWRDREERRLLRVELLDRKRKGRRLWT